MELHEMIEKKYQKKTRKSLFKRRFLNRESSLVIYIYMLNKKTVGK